MRDFTNVLGQVAAYVVIVWADSVHRDVVLQPLHTRLETPITITNPNKGSSPGLRRKNHLSHGDLCGCNNGIGESKNILESIFLLTSQTLEDYGNLREIPGLENSTLGIMVFIL